MSPSLRLIVLPALLLAGCYEQGLPGLPESELPAASHPVDPGWLDDLGDQPADLLLDEAADAAGVDADVLRALGAVATGFAPVDPGPGAMAAGSGRYGLTPEDVREASRLTGIPEDRIRTDRAADTVAAAVLLAERGDLPLPAELGRVLQRGYVGATAELPERDEPDVVVLPPWTAEQLGSLAFEAELPIGGGAADYPGAVRVVPPVSAAPRGGAVERIVLVTTEASYARSLDHLTAGAGHSAHYVLSRLDGEVSQLLPEDSAAAGPAGDLDDAVVIALATPRSGFAGWTPPLMESSARLAAYLAWRHDLPLDAEHVTTRDAASGEPSGDDLGEHFPWDAWLASAACFRAGGVDCPVASGQPEYPPPYVGGDEGRDSSDERDVAGVPYFYQYANATNPSGSCQNTSIAMVLKWLGWSGTPDSISARFGTTYAQSPAGLADVFNTLAAEAGLSARLTARTSGSVEGMRSLLAAGKPVIVHGYMTGYGHVLVATGFDGGHYTVNDPAGRWAQSWKGGYPYGWNASVGRGVRYARAPFEQAVATSNGSSYEPLWYHELTGVSGTPAPDPGPEPAGPAAPEEEVEASGDDEPGPYPSPDVELLSPTDGETVGNPLGLRARRVGGEVVEFWAGPYRLGDGVPANPAEASVHLWTLGEREIRARNVSEWGTVLAMDSARVTVAETFDLWPHATAMGDLVYQFGATAEQPGVAWVEYTVDGWLLVDSWDHESRATGEGFLLDYAFHELGENRLLVARGYDADGALIAEGRLTLTVSEDAAAPECRIVGELECGRVATGDTSAWGGYSDVINGYPDIVGNYSGPEAGWTWRAPSSGLVRIELLSPAPMDHNLDVLVLQQEEGVCTPGDLVDRAFVWLEFEAVGGADYTFVVDGFAGDAGAYELMLDCAP